MKDKITVSMFGQKRLSREGGIEIVVKELCTRMVQDGCQITCYNRSGLCCVKVIRINMDGRIRITKIISADHAKIVQTNG